MKLEVFARSLRELWLRLRGVDRTPSDWDETVRQRFDQEYEALLAEMAVQAPVPRPAPSTLRPWPPARALTPSVTERRVRDRRLTDQISNSPADAGVSAAASRPNRRAASGG